MNVSTQAENDTEQAYDDDIFSQPFEIQKPRFESYHVLPCLICIFLTNHQLDRIFGKNEDTIVQKWEIGVAVCLA